MKSATTVELVVRWTRETVEGTVVEAVRWNDRTQAGAWARTVAHRVEACERGSLEIEASWVEGGRGQTKRVAAYTWSRSHGWQHTLGAVIVGLVADAA